MYSSWDVDLAICHIQLHMFYQIQLLSCLCQVTCVAYHKYVPHDPTELEYVSLSFYNVINKVLKLSQWLLQEWGELDMVTPYAMFD